MNSFCSNCPHKKIPSGVKNKFNAMASKTFVDECPSVDTRVVGCTTKLINVDWINFAEFLKSKNLLSEEEEELIIDATRTDGS
jgi:hypothetical protein